MKIDVLAKNIEECKVIQTITGIGEKIAATIISEMITKRGLSRLCHALFMAVRSAIRDCCKKKIDG